MGVETFQGLAGGASVLGALGQVQGGREAEAAARFNAEQLELEGEREVEDAAIRESRQREQDARVLSSARANIAASGFSPTEGTSDLVVLADIAAESEKDAQLIRRAGQLRRGDLRTQAEIERGQGRSARRAGEIGAIGTLLGGAATVGRLGGIKKRPSVGKTTGSSTFTGFGRTP